MSDVVIVILVLVLYLLLQLVIFPRLGVPT